MNDNQNKSQKLIIDDVEYDTSKFNEEQLLLANHCIDLNYKVNSAQFQLQQLLVSRDTFVEKLKQALEKPSQDI